MRNYAIVIRPYFVYTDTCSFWRNHRHSFFYSNIFYILFHIGADITARIGIGFTAFFYPGVEILPDYLKIFILDGYR